jgi:aspartate-semialdehyde dehydrogenase
MTEPTPEKFPSRSPSTSSRISTSSWKTASPRKNGRCVVETKKIVDPRDQGHATCVRVPVFVGHSEAVNIEFE